MLTYVLLVTPFILVVVVVAVLMAPDRSSYWLRTALGGCAIAGGIACLSAASVAVDPDWIQPLGTLPLAAGSEFSGSFAVQHKGTFWVVLAEEGYYRRPYGPLARNEKGAETPWRDMSVPWAVTESEEPVASGTGQTDYRDGAYTEVPGPYVASLGIFDALPGRQYQVTLRVATSIPELTDEDAVVQIRVDEHVVKGASFWAVEAAGSCPHRCGRRVAGLGCGRSRSFVTRGDAS